MPDSIDYDRYPEHPLNGVPQEVLDIAREVMSEGITDLYGGLPVGETDLDAVSDSVVSHLRQAGYLRVPGSPVAESEEQILSLLRYAISDPGAFTRRRRERKDGYVEHEPVTSWSARAVLALLNVLADFDAEEIEKTIGEERVRLTVGYANLDTETIRNFDQFCYALGSNAARRIASRTLGIPAPEALSTVAKAVERK